MQPMPIPAVPPPASETLDGRRMLLGLLLTTQCLVVLLDTASALTVVGRPGTFSIRPEKIHLGDEVRAGDATAPGVVQDVVYLGSVNHYLVRLDAGPTLTVLRQNLRGTTDEAMALRGQRVTVGWAPEHVIELGTDQQLQKEES